MSFSKSFNATRVALLDIGGEELEGVPTTEVEGDDVDFTATAAQSDEIDTTLNNIDDGGNDIDELNGIADNLEDAQDDGGATPALIQMAEVAVEHRIMSLTKSKVLPKKRLLPAQEAFIGNAKTKQYSTKLAIENIRTMASKAGDTIMRWLKNIMDFFSNLFNFTKKSFEATEVKLNTMKEGLNSGTLQLSTGPQPLRLEYWNRCQVGNTVSPQVIVGGSSKVLALLNDTDGLLRALVKTTKDTKPVDYLAAYGDVSDADIVNGVSKESNDVEDVVVKRETNHDGEVIGENKSALQYLKGKASVFLAAIRGFSGKKKEAGNGLVVITKPDPLPGNAILSLTAPASPDTNLALALTATKIDIVAENSQDGGEQKADSFKSTAEAIAAIDKLLAVIAKAKSFLGGSVDAANATKANGDQLGKIESTDKPSKIKNKVQSFFRGISTASTRCYNVVIKYVAGYVSAAAGAIATMCGKAAISAGGAASKAAAAA